MNKNPMTVICADGPDNALAQAINALRTDNSLEMGSRNGPVVRFTGPVMTVWTDPTDRILWSPTRDCNPFLHYIEAAWMLAGRNDLAVVAKLAKQMSVYSDDGGKTQPGAYGFRWREYFGYDQLQVLIHELRKSRETRRCVLQMWDGHSDLAAAVKGSSDVPCNTSIYFDPCGDVLNMTVSCRSNDAVWGCYGANLVHMSILHEYVAAATGFRLGTYYQMSNNLHFYLENEATCRLMGRSEEDHVPPFETIYPWSDEIADADVGNYGFTGRAEALFFDLPSGDHNWGNPLAGDALISSALNVAMAKFLRNEVQGISDDECHFFNVLRALMDAHLVYKKDGPNAAEDYLGSCMVHSRWILAAILWLQRRPSYKA